MELGCKIILHLACRKLKDKDTFTKSDPQIFIFMKRLVNNRLTDQWEQIGKTEQIKDNLNPNFKASFIIDYIFEVKQPIRFEVRDIDGDNYDKLGNVETTVGILFGSKNQTCILDLDLGGKLITMCEKYQDLNELYVMKIHGFGVKGSWCSSPNPSFKLYKCVNQNEFFAYESETIHSTNAPQWKIIQMKQFRIGSKFKLELCDSVHKILGNVIITIEELKQGKRQFTISNGGGNIVFDQFDAVIKPSFMDYIQGGTQLNLTIAIDFTGSNGHPSDVGSLHYINGNNQYLQALTSVGEILLAYDYDKMIPCYGFGAVLKYPQLKTYEAIHCFPLSGDNQNTSAFQLEGIQQIYQYALNNVTLAGPTYFGPIIEETMKLAQQTKMQEQNQYLILLILTDGAIYDFSLVQEQLERAAFLPMSIIIIGVGDDDFQLMKQLDNDLPPGSAQYSNKRDLVQFVPFKQFSHSMLLAKEVLEELPDQLVSYMELQGIKPRQAPVHNIELLNVTMPQAQQQQ